MNEFIFENALETSIETLKSIATNDEYEPHFRIAACNSLADIYVAGLNQQRQDRKMRNAEELLKGPAGQMAATEFRLLDLASLNQLLAPTPTPEQQASGE